MLGKKSAFSAFYTALSLEQFHLSFRVTNQEWKSLPSKIIFKHKVIGPKQVLPLFSRCCLAHSGNENTMKSTVPWKNKILMNTCTT